MRDHTLAEHIASTAEAIRTCERSGNTEWQETWGAVLRSLARDYLPRGSGIDCGTTIREDLTGAARLVMETEFHHMDEFGCYDGWTQHRITARPTFGPDVSITVSGRDRNGIKDYLAEVFQSALVSVVPDAEWAALVNRHRAEH